MRAPAAGIALAVLFAALFAACEKPDASNVTSPSALALLGTTSGTVAYAPADAPPPPLAAPEGWQFTLENVRFSTLENGQPSLQVISQLQSRAGPAMELWMAGPSGTIFRWTGGTAHGYDGVVCFQLRLADADAALPLPDATGYTFTIAFRDGASGQVVAAQSITVAGRPSQPERPAPSPGSPVVRDLLGCPRTVI